MVLPLGVCGNVKSISWQRDLIRKKGFQTYDESQTYEIA